MGENDLLASYVLEVLLASGDAEAGRFALPYLEMGLRPKENILQWELAAVMVGRYRLDSFTTILKQSGTAPDEKVIAATSLAKLGDEEAKKVLRASLNNPRYTHLIVRNTELVTVLELDEPVLPADPLKAARDSSGSIASKSSGSPGRRSTRRRRFTASDPAVAEECGVRRDHC